MIEEVSRVLKPNGQLRLEIATIKKIGRKYVSLCNVQIRGKMVPLQIYLRKFQRRKNPSIKIWSSLSRFVIVWTKQNGPLKFRLKLMHSMTRDLSLLSGREIDKGLAESCYKTY